MEVNKSRSVGVPKPEKKKPQLNLFVGGGGGLVLLGGGMAVAALVAAFTVIKNKHHTSRGNKNEEPTSITPDDDDNVQKRDASPGLSFVLQTPTTLNQNSCCTSLETSAIAVTVPHIDSCELVSVTEDKPVPIIIADGIENPGTSNQQILASDDSSEESITSSYDIIAAEEFTLPAPDGVPNLDEPEIMIENDYLESFEFIETDQVKKEDEAVDAEVLSGEENLPMPLVEEEDEDDGVYVENVVEKEEENPEGNLALEGYSAMQEILVSDDSDQESIALGNDMLCADNSSLAVPDDSFLDIEPENLVSNNSGENVQFTETIEVIKEKEAVNTDKLVVEANLPIQSIEEREDNSCEELVIDKEEESPEGKLAVEENLMMQSVKKEAEEEAEEETENDSSEEHAPEIGEEGSQGKLAEEDNSVTQSVEEEEEEEDESEDDDDNDDGDDSSEEVTEEEEDSSEGTGSSSMDSHVEAIWPAEMIDTPPLELKELNVNYQNSRDMIADEDRVVKTGNNDLVDCKSDGKTVYEVRGGTNETTENSRMMLNKKAAQELVTMKDQTAHSPKGRIWIWSMMVLVFLLLLLYIRRTAIPQDLPYHDSVIVA
ncbi:hypothetical protein Dsin_025471 [Dipteronia sinensis]|uniref:Uncharacterized protein n=1 Tax=Dipteronia sinensis TaxID=43782 RepID=A0AAE0DX57_9ROSI|nr:hypothetical protein Dsin_025471 [Dipteronia sinensis]